MAYKYKTSAQICQVSSLLHDSYFSVPSRRVPCLFHTAVQSMLSTKSSRTQIACAVLQRRVIPQKLLDSVIHSRTLILFGQWLFTGVGATWTRMWKSLSSTSHHSAGSSHRPWSGMQDVKRENDPSLGCCAAAQPVSGCPRLGSNSSEKPLPIHARLLLQETVGK